MCGIVGIAGKLAYKDEATMRRLLIFDFLRGPDSTGLAAVRGATQEVHIAKLKTNPLDLFDTRMFNNALSGASSSVFIGHNRAATRGAVNNTNAHPFYHGSIVGAHNGTLVNKDTQALEEMLGTKFGTDSETLFAAMSVFGPEAVIPMLHKGVTKSDGAWSLVWYDTEKRRLNFLRNEHRPMWYAFNKEFDRIFWASEYWMLDSAFNSQPDAYNEYQDADGCEFFQTDEDVLYSWDIDELKKGGKEPPKPEMTPLAGQEPVASNITPFDRRTNGQTNNGNSHGNGTTGTAANSNSTTTSHGKPTLKVLHLEGTPALPYANMLTEEELGEAALTGCQWCGAPINYGDHGFTLFERDHIAVCSDCVGSTPTGEKRSTRLYIPRAEMDRIS